MNDVGGASARPTPQYLYPKIADSLKVDDPFPTDNRVYQPNNKVELNATFKHLFDIELESRSLIAKLSNYSSVKNDPLRQQLEVMQALEIGRFVVQQRPPKAAKDDSWTCQGRNRGQRLVGNIDKCLMCMTPRYVGSASAVPTVSTKPTHVGSASVVPPSILQPALCQRFQ